MTNNRLVEERNDLFHKDQILCIRHKRMKKGIRRLKSMQQELQNEGLI